MKQRLPSSRRLLTSLAAVSALTMAGSLTWITTGAQAAPASNVQGAGTVMQTNLVSDLPGVADITDPNMQNPWGIADSATSPFWLSDNNNGLSTLYSVPGANSTPVSIDGLVVTIPTPVSATGGAPDGIIQNSLAGAFPVTSGGKTGTSAFVFDTEDGTILGWAPSVETGSAIIAEDNSGNNFTNPDPNQQTGAVYKGLALGTSTTPIIASDANSTELLYAANFRAGTIEVYDTMWGRPMLTTDAFTDPALPPGYAPFDVQVLNSKLYVTYARQDASKHDDTAGFGNGFVDVFNLNGTPGLAGGRVRLISRGVLDSPWGLAIAPAGFAGISAPNSDPVLLVGNFGNGRIHAYDANNGLFLGGLHQSNGRPIDINELWALRVGNGGSGGAANTIYFTSGPFNQTHGIFGSLTTATPGSAIGQADQQWVTMNTDVVNLDVQQLNADEASGAPAATIQADIQTLIIDSTSLAQAEAAVAADNALAGA